MITIEGSEAALAAFTADTSLELEDRVHLYRRWLLDCARLPMPHRNGTFLAVLTRGLDLITSEIDRRRGIHDRGRAGGSARVAKVRPWPVTRGVV